MTDREKIGLSQICIFSYIDNIREIKEHQHPNGKQNIIVYYIYFSKSFLDEITDFFNNFQWRF